MYIAYWTFHFDKGHYIGIFYEKALDYLPAECFRPSDCILMIEWIE